MRISKTTNHFISQMPEIKPIHVLSFSSEDKSFPADNLLKVNAFSKWKCDEAGTKQAVVSFKFDRCYQINRLDIGNEGSAFVEVHVSRSSSPVDIDEVLLPSSSFMSPADAKTGTSLNRVRLFSHNELTPAVTAQKWDIVKVICTQPFNNTIQYGLSFIRFYIPAEEVEENQNAESLTKPEVASGSSIPVVREDDAMKKLENNHEDETTVNKEKKKNSSPVLKQKSKSPTPTTSRPNSPNSTVQGNKPSTSTAHSHHRKPLDGVVVAFSGYQNPFRSELRSMCLKLGAKYFQDWNNQCTHLICAFPNTPKWRSVKGIGVITSHKWIQACNTAKRRVSWRPFRVGRAPSPPGHVSDTQDDDEDRDSSDWEQSIIEDTASDEWQPGQSDIEDNDDEESEEDSDASADSTDDENSNSDSNDGFKKIGSRRKHPTNISKKSNLNIKKPKRVATMDVADNGDTDDELQRQIGAVNATANSSATRSLSDLPDIFTGKTFYLFSKDLPIKEEEILYRLIIAFGGKVESHMTTAVDFVVTSTTWCNDFDDALTVSPNIIFAKPDWLYACDKASKLVPFQRYQVAG